MIQTWKIRWVSWDRVVDETFVKVSEKAQYYVHDNDISIVQAGVATSETSTLRESQWKINSRAVLSK